VKDIALALIKFPIKLYLITWTYFLIWRGRRIPQWLQGEFKQQFEEEIPLGKPEKYNM
jgi:hypothetical protein